METKLEKQLHNNHDIDLTMSIFDYENFDYIIKEIEDNNLLDVDIIYYSNAIEYLQDNDPSFQSAFKAAAEYGFDCSNLNSETLASILATQTNYEDFYNNVDDYQEMFDDILEMLEMFTSSELQKMNALEDLHSSQTYRDLTPEEQERAIDLFNEITED